MNYMQIEKASVSNGIGFRVVLWVSGCTLHCAYCQNPETWDFFAGKEFTEDAKNKMFEALDKDWVKGITFSGGHPLERANIKTVNELIHEIRDEMPDKDIWLYTGLDLSAESFEIVDIPEYSPDAEYKFLLADTLRCCDVVVDGRYIHEERDVTLPFRGSSNQRIIDVKRTIENKKIMLYEW